MILNLEYSTRYELKYARPARPKCANQSFVGATLSNYSIAHRTLFFIVEFQFSDVPRIPCTTPRDGYFDGIAPISRCLCSPVAATPNGLLATASIPCSAHSASYYPPASYPSAFYSSTFYSSSASASTFAYPWPVDASTQCACSA